MDMFGPHHDSRCSQSLLNFLEEHMVCVLLENLINFEDDRSQDMPKTVNP